MNRACAVLLGCVLGFAALAKGAHDIWAATLVYLVVLLFFVALLVARNWPPESSGLKFPLAVPLALLLLILGASFHQSVNPSESFLSLMDWTAAALFFLLAANVVSDDDARDLLLKTLVPVLFCELAINVFERFSMGAGLTAEAPGSLVNANLQTAFLLFWVPPLWDKSFGGQRHSLWYWRGALGAAIAGIVLSYSTWGLVCLVLGLGLTFFKRGRTPIVLVAAVSFIIITLLISAKFIPIEAGLLSPYASADRIEWWKAGWRMFRDHPWLGVGLGNYPSAYLAYKSGAVQNTLYAHSFVVMLLAEAGTIGTGAALVFFGSWGVAVARRADLGGRRPYMIGALAFLLYSSVSLGFEYLVNLLTCAAFLGIAVAPEERAPCFKFRKAAVVVAVGLGIGALPFIVSPFFASRNVVSGWMELRGGSATEAEKFFSAASALDPLSFEAHHGWAASLRSKFTTSRDRKDLEEALKHERRALELNRLQPALQQDVAKAQRDVESLP